MSLTRRLFGVFFRPAGTFRSLAERPVWVDALAVALAAGAVFCYLAFPFVQQDRLRTFEAGSAGFIAQYGRTQYESAVARIKGKDRELEAFVVRPLIMLTGLALASLVALGAGRAVAGGGHYLPVFSSFVHASFVSAILGNAVRLGLVLARGPALSFPTGLGALFPGLPAGSAVGAALGQVDLFSVWMYGLFGLGLAAAFGVRAAKGLAISYSLWLLRGAAGFALAVIGRGFLL